jgi:hypothetical protein
MIFHILSRFKHHLTKHLSILHPGIYMFFDFIPSSPAVTSRIRLFWWTTDAQGISTVFDLLCRESTFCISPTCALFGTPNLQVVHSIAWQHLHVVHRPQCPVCPCWFLSKITQNIIMTFTCCWSLLLPTILPPIYVHYWPLQLWVA